MIHLCNWRWAIIFCGLTLMVGVLHGMKESEMYDSYSQLIEDFNELLSLTVEYMFHTFLKLAKSGPSDRLEAVADHYSLMVGRAEPLFEVIGKDLEKLMFFLEDLSSVDVFFRLLYDFFRQSAVDLIDHLTYVYNLS